MQQQQNATHHITVTAVTASAIVQIVTMPATPMTLAVTMPNLPAVAVPMTIIQNQGAGDVYIGPSNVENDGGTTAIGFLLKGGLTPPDYIALPFCGNTWAKAKTGQTSTIVVDQIY